MRKLLEIFAMPVVEVDSNTRSQSSLLSLLFLIVIVFTPINSGLPTLLAKGITTASDYTILTGSICTSLLVIVPYVLTRFGRIRLAVWSFSLIMLLGVWVTFSVADPSQRPRVLSVAVFVVFVSTLFLQPKEYLSILVISTIGTLGLPIFFSNANIEETIRNTFEMLLSSALLLILIARYRNILETEHHAILQATEAKTAALLRVIPDLIIWLDREGHYRNIQPSPYFETILPVESLLGKTVYETFSPEFAETCINLVHDVLDTGDVRIHEYPLVNAQGETRYYEARFIRYVSSEALILIRDITKRRQAEDTLRESEARFRAIFEQVSDVLFVVSPEGVITSLNPRFKDVFGDDPEHWIGKPFTPLIHPEDIPKAQEGFRLTLVDSAPPSLGLRVQVAEGQYRFFDFRARAMRQGELVVGILGAGRDVTEQREAEAHKMTLALEQERMTFLKQFITGFSHDMRTPLTSISTSAYLVRRKLPAEIQDSTKANFSTLEAGIATITRHLDQLVTVTNLEYEITNSTFAAVPLTQLVQTAVEQQQASAKSLGHSLSYMDETAGVVVMCNEVELIRAITQLLINALHYTPYGGEIIVRAKQTASEGIVEVQDTGIGIAPDDLLHIFEPFFRADRARNLETGGMGLGLSLTKIIVEGHAGHIQAISEQGKGSTFRILLPRITS